MKKIKELQIVLLGVCCLMACGSSTSILASYKSPDVSKPVAYKKIFISALTSNVSARQTVESELGRYMGTKGIDHVRSLDVFTPDLHTSGADKDTGAVMNKIRATGCDGILTVALQKQETETRWVPGSTYPAYGVGYYGTFGAYYSYGYNSFNSQGYYENDKIYFIETNIYDVKSEKLIWSAQSKTYNPSSLETFLEEYEVAIEGQLVKDGLVAPAKK
jgi:hypothetical protein